MSPKTRKIVGWVLAGLIAAFLIIGSAPAKFMSGEKIEQMMASMGLTLAMAKAIGTIEIVAAVLFLIPRTGMLGLLLLSAYLGGAIATHLEHPQGDPPYAAAIVMAVLWITALIRFPELGWRISGKKDLTPA